MNSPYPPHLDIPIVTRKEVLVFRGEQYVFNRESYYDQETDSYWETTEMADRNIYQVYDQYNERHKDDVDFVKAPKDE